MRHAALVVALALVLGACGSTDGGGTPPDDAACADDCSAASDAVGDDTAPSDAAQEAATDGRCPASGTAVGEGCGRLLLATCTPDASKLLLCSNVDDCLVWTVGVGCSAGTACQQTTAEKATCCIAPGTTTGSACPSDGATTCAAGGKVLTCAPKELGDCRVWSAATDCVSPKTCPSGGSACTCPAPGSGAGEGCAPGTKSCQPGGKIYSCASEGGCNVFTLNETCSSGACGSMGTCCTAVGTTAGSGCTTEGATTCGSTGATTLLTCTRGTDGCLSWAATTCTDSLVCGGTPAACQCPTAYPITQYIVDPARSNASWRPTGTTLPGCAFARITDALAAPRPGGTSPPQIPIIVQGATVKRAWLFSTAYSMGATVSPVWSNGHFYTAQTAGTSAATEPTWCTTSACTVVDGDVTWRESGTTTAVELKNETFPIVIKGRVRVISSGCDTGSTNCTPNGYVIRFSGASTYAAVDVAAIGDIPLFRGFRVANDSATPPAAMVKTSSGSVDLMYVEAFGDSDTNTVRAPTGFLSTGGFASIRYSSARRCAGYGAVLSNNCTFNSNLIAHNTGGGVEVTGSVTANDNIVTDNGATGLRVGSGMVWNRGRIARNAGDGVRVITTGNVTIDGTSIDHNGGSGVRLENGRNTLLADLVFRNGGGGIVVPAGTPAATLAVFRSNQVYCNVGAQIAFYAGQLGGAPFDLSGGNTACGAPTASSVVYGYGGTNPGTIGVLGDPANIAGVNASWISWASGTAAPSSPNDFSGLTTAQSTAASSQWCAFTPPACPP